MKQCDKLNKFANVPSYTISKLQDSFYLMSNISECKFETKQSVYKGVLHIAIFLYLHLLPNGTVIIQVRCLCLHGWVSTFVNVC